MKQLKTILDEASEMSDWHEFIADAERMGEISRAVYLRACKVVELSEDEALESLRENYQRAGLAHLFSA